MKDLDAPIAPADAMVNALSQSVSDIMEQIRRESEAIQQRYKLIAAEAEKHGFKLGFNYNGPPIFYSDVMTLEMAEAWGYPFPSCAAPSNESESNAVHDPVYERKAGWENDGVIIHESDMKAAREITAKGRIGYGESIRRGESFVERVEAVALGHALARLGVW